MISMTYKAYIDGLRALAVVVVILFHLNPEVFSGGYLGVDIFFVISGFVISQSLYKNYLKVGKIDIKKFYIRRFMRLYPALISMISATAIVYLFFGFLWDTNLFIKSSLFSIFAVSNLYYIKQAENYFHQDLVNPLLHTWSLGIEEQFYLLYPFLLVILLFLIKKFKLRLSFVVSVLGFGSIVLYSSFVTGGDSLLGNFYFPTARFWELGVGCLLFFYSQNNSLGNKASAASLVGLLSLLSILLFKDQLNNLYIETLVTTLATATLIYSGLEYKSKIIKLLENKKVVFIGKVSYSLYLWHLPVIYFSNLYLNSFWYYFWSIVLTVIFALISYKYIETPMRYSGLLDRHMKMLKYIGISGVTAVSVLVIGIGPSTLSQKVNGSLNDFSDDIKEVNYIESQYQLGSRIRPNHIKNAFNSDLVCTDVLKENDLFQNAERGVCSKGQKNDTLIFLTGDSHGRHFVPMLDASSLNFDTYFYSSTNQMIYKSSDPFSGGNLSMNKQVERVEYLSGLYEELVVVSSLFISQFPSDLAQIRENMYMYTSLLTEYSKVILVAPTPLFTAGPQACVVSGVHCEISKEEDEERRKEILLLYKDLANKSDKVFLYDPYEEICPENTCFIYDHQADFLWYIDDDHLSVEGSRKLSGHFDSWYKREVE